MNLTELKSYNIKAAWFHAAALLGMVIVTFLLKPKFRAASVFRLAAAAPDPGEPVDSSIDYPVTLKRVFKMPIPWLVVAFFAFTVLAHVLYGTDFFGRGTYSSWVNQGWNPGRWVEYAVSAGIMSIILGTLSGARDVAALWPIAVATAGLQFCGLLVERDLTKAVQDPVVLKYATYLGWGLLSAAWVPILFSISTVIADAKSHDSSVPSWIPIIVALQLLQFSWFGFIQRKQVQAALSGAALPSFFDIEKKYIRASFTSKLALGGAVGYGLLGRQLQSNSE